MRRGQGMDKEKVEEWMRRRWRWKNE